MTSPIARQAAAFVAASPVAGGLLLGRQPWPAWVAVVVVVSGAFVVGRLLDYRLGRAAIAKTDAAHTATVVAAVTGHSVLGPEAAAGAGADPAVAVGADPVR